VLIHVVDFSGKTDIEGETTEGHDPREDIDFLEEELDEWYLDVLEKGLEKVETRYHGADAAIEKELAEQMSAFGIDKDRMKQVILAEGLELDPETWDDADKAELAREIRKRTKPMVVAANKMDTPEAQANWETITTDPDYDHLSFVPASAHAEKALKNANEAGVVDYTPGESDFDIVGDVSGEQEAGLDQIGEFVAEYDGTGVQGARSKPPSSTYSTVSPSSPAPRTGAKTRRGLPRLLYPPRWVDDRGLRVPHPLGYRRGAPPRHRLSERPAGRHRSRALPPRCDRTDLDEAGRAVSQSTPPPESGTSAADPTGVAASGRSASPSRSSNRAVGRPSRSQPRCA